jgi:hypothetical protein
VQVYLLVGLLAFFRAGLLAGTRAYMLCKGVFACFQSCVHSSLPADVLACKRACVQVCLRGGMFSCTRAYFQTILRARVLTCHHACVKAFSRAVVLYACVHACVVQSCFRAGILAYKRACMHGCLRERVLGWRIFACTRAYVLSCLCPRRTCAQYFLRVACKRALCKRACVQACLRVGLLTYRRVCVQTS